MFSVIYDHNMDWGDCGDSDTCVEQFPDRESAVAFAADMHGRIRDDRDECGCLDSWFVRRVVHGDTIIDPIEWRTAG